GAGGGLAPPAGGGPAAALALVAHGPAGATVPAGRRPGAARAVRAGAGAEEPRHAAHLGPLPRAFGPGAARRGQLLLHGLPVFAAARAGPQAVPAGLELAARPAQQVAGRRAIRRRAVYLRGVRPVGGAGVDRLAHRGLLRRRPARGRPVQARLL